MIDVRDQMLSQFASEGWDGLDMSSAAFDAARKQMVAEQRAQMLGEAAPIAAVLRTPGGQHMLRWLMKKTIFADETADEQTATTAEHYALLKARRAGQKSILAMLLATLQVVEDASTAGSMQ